MARKHERHKCLVRDRIHELIKNDRSPDPNAKVTVCKPRKIKPRGKSTCHVYKIYSPNTAIVAANKVLFRRRDKAQEFRIYSSKPNEMFFHLKKGLLGFVS